MIEWNIFFSNLLRNEKINEILNGNCWLFKYCFFLSFQRYIHKMLSQKNICWYIQWLYRTIFVTQIEKLHHASKYVIQFWMKLLSKHGFTEFIFPWVMFEPFPLLRFNLYKWACKNFNVNTLNIVPNRIILTIEFI